MISTRIGLGVVSCALLVAVTAAQGQPARHASSAPATAPATRGGDDALLRAEAYVAKHGDRYLHHDKLKRGMTGYGLTVMAGTEIVRFDATIVSVMKKWGPHQDVILAKLKGLDLETSGIIAGMSGSPVYITDPADGKLKLIGAVAYGWSAPKEPLCGIQPITQMLAINGILGQGRSATTRPSNTAVTANTGGGRASAAYLGAMLSPQKKNFAALGLGKAAPKASGDTPQLLALRTPLMVSGMSDRSLKRATDALSGSGLVLVRSGGAGESELEDLKGLKLAPGSGISVPLVSGDADWSAVGTVTEVIDDKVLAFGHSFFSEGDTALPMGPAYVHTVVSGVVESFKLASPANVCGALTRDETVGIAGRVGDKVSTIPMVVNVTWKDRGEVQTYRYQVVRHRLFTPLLMFNLVDEACLGWHQLPENHTIRYSICMDFTALGQYCVENVTSNADTGAIGSDLARPVQASLMNPWRNPPELKSVTVDITVEEQASVADILELRLDGKVYRPGETVTGTVVIQPFRSKKQTMPVKLELPKDLPLGSYTLTACNNTASVEALQAEMPQRFDPRSLEDLFKAMQMVVTPRADQVYLRLPLPHGGLALRKKELANLPESIARVLAQSDAGESALFTRALVKALPGKYVFSGGAAASFEVKDKTREIRTRD